MNNQLIIQILNKIKDLLGENSVAISHEEKVLVYNTVTNLSVPEGVNKVLIQVESSETTNAVVRFWEDGSKPTLTSGFFRYHNDIFDVNSSENLKKFRIISISESTTKLFITYYK
jgi:hypothetical protein